MSYSKCANDTDCSKEHGGIHSDDISEYWEAVASHGLGLPWKRWHIAFLVVSGIMSFVILVCCCIKFRIPRTKQEIEADYVRRKILRKFKERLKAIQNQELDEMDLKKALDKIRSEFKSDSESIAQSEAGFSAATLSSAAVAGGAHGSTYRRASQIQIDISLEELRAHTLGMKARFILALNRLLGRSRVSQSDKVALTLDINAEGDTQLNVTESAVKANNGRKDTEVKKVGKAVDKKKELPVKEDNKVKPESSKDKKGKGKEEKKGKPTKPTKSDPEQPGSSGVVAGSSKTPGKGAPPPATVKVENEKAKKGKVKGEKGKGKDEPAKENDKTKPVKPNEKSEAPKDKSVKPKDKTDTPKDKAEKPKDKPEKPKPPADKDEKTKHKAEKEKEEKEKVKLEKEKQKQEKEKQKAEKEKQKLEKEKEKVAKAKEKADQVQQKKLEEQKKKDEKVKSKPDKSKEKDTKGKDGNKGP